MGSNGLKEACRKEKPCLRKHGKEEGSGRSQWQHEIKPFTRWGGVKSEAGQAMDPGIQSQQQASSPEGVEQFEGRPLLLTCF